MWYNAIVIGFHAHNPKGKYMPLAPKTKIRFLKSSKYDYDFKKGDVGRVERVISPFPSATDTIYLVYPEGHADPVWVTGKDIESFEQLTLLADNEPYTCNASFNEDGFHLGCIREDDHPGMHMDEAGVFWPRLEDMEAGFFRF